ncbi:hypothetical protein AA098_14765 [Pseudomonas sp. JY-Q]|nr:hypothetical protein AA098_14765 [Pseudomonas sp. JY-Q]
MSMSSKRNRALEGLVKEGFFDVESVARLFEINSAIGQQYAEACAELEEPRVASMVRFLAELDSLAKQHSVSPRQVIVLLDPDHFERKGKRSKGADHQDS